MTNAVKSPRRILSVTCARNQKLLVGQDVSITVNSTFLRKHDGKPCVRLNIELPQDLSVYKANLMEEGTDVPYQDICPVIDDASPTDSEPVSSASQLGAEGAHGVNNAQTQPVQKLSTQKVLQASEVSNASDTAIAKSNRAGILKLSKVATTMKEHRHELAIEKLLANEASAIIDFDFYNNDNTQVNP